MPNIGIDFGTTNSVIVAYNKKKNEFTYFNFARRRGGAPIPTSSTVWYHDNLVEVGKNARDNICLLYTSRTSRPDARWGRMGREIEYSTGDSWHRRPVQ